ncbi:MAG: hypothetical protein VW976_02690 [Flavobacteriaceae bacterium]
MTTFPLKLSKAMRSPVGEGPSNKGAISPMAVGLTGALTIFDILIPDLLLRMRSL